MKIQNNIKVLRKVTQRYMAKELGITHVHLCNLENHQCLPSLELAFKIANFFGKPFSEVFWEKENEQARIPR